MLAEAAGKVFVFDFFRQRDLGMLSVPVMIQYNNTLLIHKKEIHLTQLSGCKGTTGPHVCAQKLISALRALNRHTSDIFADFLSIKEPG